MFTKIRMKEEKGFTLIELLIVVAIIGILAAIAIPQFGAYRKRGYNAAAQSDLRSIRTTEEAMMADFQDYGTSQLSTAAAAGSGGVETTVASLALVGGKTTSTPQTVSLSPNVRAAVEGNTTGADVANSAYVAVTAHISGDQFYGGDSDTTTLYRKNRAGTYTAGDALTAAPASTLDTDNIAAATGWVTTQ